MGKNRSNRPNDPGEPPKPVLVQLTNGNPYTISTRRTPVCGTRKIGIWLFLASEVMLFGGLFQPIFSCDSTRNRANGRTGYSMCQLGR